MKNNIYVTLFHPNIPNLKKATTRISMMPNGFVIYTTVEWLSRPLFLGGLLPICFKLSPHKPIPFTQKIYSTNIVFYKPNLFT